LKKYKSLDFVILVLCTAAIKPGLLRSRSQ
jgi:hypothetical protein